MLNYNKQFTRPATRQRTLQILSALANESELSQHAIGKQTGLSAAMINRYLKQFQNEKLIKSKAINAKNFKYLLTAQGNNLRRELMNQYFAEIVRSYTAIKQSVRTKLKSILKKQTARVALFGASETCEVVMAALQNTNIKILALVDNDKKKQGQTMAGYTVFSPDILTNIHCDAVIITSFGCAKDISKQLAQLNTNQKINVIEL